LLIEKHSVARICFSISNIGAVEFAMRRTTLLTTLCLALVVCTATGPLLAQTSVTFMTYDTGRTSCGTWIDARAARNNDGDVRFLQAKEWASGFITAYNYIVHPRGHVAASTDREGLYAWLDKYCQQNPTEKFVEAVVALIEHLNTQ
jgi:hypothetical protein